MVRVCFPGVLRHWLYEWLPDSSYDDNDSNNDGNDNTDDEAMRRTTAATTRMSTMITGTTPPKIVLKRFGNRNDVNTFPKYLKRVEIISK